MPDQTPEQLRNARLKELRKESKHVVIDEQVSTYIDRLLLETESEEMKQILKETLAFDHSDMQVPLSEARFLESLVHITGATKILEVGTFKGFSSLFLARALPVDGKLITCEKDLREWPIAYGFWKRLGLEEKIELRKVRALQLFEDLIAEQQVFDLIFLDADKENYETYLEKSLQLLRPHGVVLIDNILWAGLVAYEDPGDNVGRNVQKFNDYVFKTYGAQASIVPAWDGIIMVVKKK